MPLTFDFPLDKLKTYMGINPRPADFDTYWDNARAEMRALDPQIELIPAGFKTSFADCFHMYFTGVGGARIHAKLVQPRHAESPHPAILMFHGYSSSAPDWANLLTYVAGGYTVAFLDCRGQGGLSEDKGGVQGWTLRGHIVRGLEDALNGAPENMLFRQIFLDTAQMARIVMDMPDVDENRVGATGGSQGGALTVACSALEPRVKRAAPIFPFLSDYKRVWEMDLAKNSYDELSEWFRRFDPTHQRENDVFTMLGYIDIQNLAPSVKAETLWCIGLMDQVCPPSTQFAAYNKMTASKSMRIYPDHAHEDLPRNNDAIYQFLTGL